MKKKTNIFEMFLTFFKIGLFTFGGGYAMLALIEGELVEKKKWIEKEEFLDMVAIAESTPGPIAINSATYIGYKRGGVLGAVCSTLGVVLPSFIIIFAISLFLEAFLTFELVRYAFCGIQACVVYLIISAAAKMLKGLKKTPMSIAILCVVTLIMVALSIFAASFSTIVLIIISGCVGLAVHYLGVMTKKGDESK